MEEFLSLFKNALSSPWTYAASTAVLSLLIILLRRLAIPTYYPGIPHHSQGSGRLFGDLTRYIGWAKTNGQRAQEWMALQCYEIGSPVIQVALKPFNRPFIIVGDHATVQEIVSRRTPRDFDRAQTSGDFFSPLLPEATFGMKSTDHFRIQRGMWSPTMSPSFMNNIGAAHIHSCFARLVKLWARKVDLSSGRPFDAIDDVKLTTLDAIWGITHGAHMGAIQAQLDNLLSKKSADTTAHGAVSFPRHNLPPLAKAVEDLLKTIKPNKPSAKLYDWYLMCLPSFWHAWFVKEKSVAKLLRSTREKFSGADRAEINCAMDYVISKEIATQEKTGKATISDRAIKDEIFLFLIAGHETTSTTLQWFLKIMADNQGIQQELHHTLCSGFSGFSDKHVPSVEEILQADMPYLDAVVHETLRVARTTPMVLRQAVVDTEILGYPIPKGTEVLLSFQGDSYLLDETIKKPSIPVGANKDVSKLEKQWGLKGKRDFEPSRWLSMTEDGRQLFDPNAGPSLPFSAGTRGCFGKRMAMLELRISIALLARNFHFLPVPDALNSYDNCEMITRMPTQCYVRPSVAD